MGIRIQAKLLIDNQAAIVMSTDPTYSRRTRHIELKWHFIRDLVQQKKLTVSKISNELNLADILTKPLPGYRLQYLCSLSGVKIPDSTDFSTCVCVCR